MKCGSLIGVGNTAEVYDWEKGKVLKLFYEGYPLESVEEEFHNARSVNDLDFPKPRAYEIVTLDSRVGIVYDKVVGESLLEWVMKNGDVSLCSQLLAKTHKEILKHEISGVQNYKEFLRDKILCARLVEIGRKERALGILEKLPEGHTLCHGDFHPGNILMLEGQAAVIDFMNICHGNPLYDIARTVYLVQYTPVPAEVEDKDSLMQMKKTVADMYLMEMKVTRESIRDYLEVIAVARAGECPGEVPAFMLI